MIVTSIDGNNKLFPITIGVIEIAGESHENGFFFELRKNGVYCYSLSIISN